MPTCTIIEDACDLPKIEGLWRELYLQSDSATLFQSFSINRNAAQVFAQRERPYVVAIDGDCGAAIIPACVHQNGLRFIGEELFDYPSTLASCETALWHAWKALESFASPLHLRGIREPGFWTQVAPFAGAPHRGADVPLPKHARMEKNLHALLATGCCMEMLPQGPALSAAVRRMYTLKGKHRSGALFRDPLRVEGVVAMCEAEDLQPELHVLFSGEELVTAALTFIDRATCHFYGIYFDERWAVYSPGVALLYHLVKQAQSRGLDFDFMTGEQPYKLRFASGIRQLFQVAAVPALLSSAIAF